VSGRESGDSRWDGHVALLYADEEQRRAGVAAWVRRGLETDSKIVYVESRNEPVVQSLFTVLTEDDVDVTDAVRRGQVEIVDPSVGLGPAWQARLVEDGLAAGYPAVRLGGDAGTSSTVMSPSAHVEAERAADELCRTAAASILCQYPSTLPGSLLERACSLHGGGVRAAMVDINPIQDGIAVTGEADLSNASALRAALAAGYARLSEQVTTSFAVDLAGLHFLDVAAARALVTGTSVPRSRGVDVRLRSAVPIVDFLLRQLGVDTIDGLTLESGL
jgi:anti-anti-sigma regulatory factor